MREPRCDLQSEQVRPSYVWRRVGLIDGRWFIGRVKTEGRNSHRGIWYMFYGKLSIWQTGPKSQSSGFAVAPVTRPDLPRAHPHDRANEVTQAGSAHWCYCWVGCKNRGRIMLSPTTSRGLLGHFPRGADLPAANQCVSPLTVRLLTYLSLRAILVARAGGGDARGGASRRRIPRDCGVGGRGEGGQNRDGWVNTRGTEGWE